MSIMLHPAHNSFAVAQFLSTVVPAGPDLIIFGFPEYAAKLTPAQQKLIDGLAAKIVDSHRLFHPVVAIVIVGHSDKDLRANNPERKRGETPQQFEIRISGARAARAREALLAKIRNLSRGKPNHQLEQLLSDPKRCRIVAMGATDRLDKRPDITMEQRKVNRRVEFHLFTALVVDPDAPKPPAPTPDRVTELPKRVNRCLDILQKKAMPSGPVQTDRIKCILAKLRDNPSVNDRFVDGAINPVLIKGRQVNGLKHILHSYGEISEADFQHFFSRFSDILISDPRLSTNAAEAETIAALDALDRRRLEGEAFLDSHFGRFGKASCPTKVKLQQVIGSSQANGNSIYSCR